eukprot:COSAG02_NODE_1941_length_10311_cov_5.935272_4_plen_125_part_00
MHNICENCSSAQDRLEHSISNEISILILRNEACFSVLVRVFAISISIAMLRNSHQARPALGTACSPHSILLLSGHRYNVRSSVIITIVNHPKECLYRESHSNCVQLAIFRQASLHSSARYRCTF